MPTINKPTKRKKSEHTETENRKLRQSAYNTTTWRKMREAQIKRHPLCEECEKKGRVTPASSVHHIKSPFKNGSVDWNLFLDPNNLESICHKCHAEIHNSYSPEQILKELERIMDENIPDEELE